MEKHFFHFMTFQDFSLANSRFIHPIDLLTFPPIGGTFFRIQDGSKPKSLDTFLSRPQVSQKSISRDENGIQY
jgi:hypothetical protein